MADLACFCALEHVSAEGHCRTGSKHGSTKCASRRSITLGKVVTALTIFAFGLLTARWVYRLTSRLGSRWFKKEQQTADVPAKAFAAIVALVSLLVAMASVRIPWTVFAFMGGALACG